MQRSVTRWEPFAELADLRSRIDRAFVDFTDSEARSWAPPMDVIRQDGELVLRADVPGIEPTEIQIEVEGDQLSLSGEQTEESETSDESFMRRERRSGSFIRTIRLPDGCDTSRIQATTHDGVLEIHVPVDETTEARKIAVSAR